MAVVRCEMLMAAPKQRSHQTPGVLIFSSRYRMLVGTFVIDLRFPMPNLLSFEDLQVGDQWISPHRVVSESDVANFADLTGDFDRLHTDKEFAADTPFGRPIAHGLLGLSFVAGLSSKCPAMDTVAFVGVKNWSFLQPIFFGDEVHVVTEVVELSRHGRKRGKVIWKRSLINQDGRVTQEGLLETLVACKVVAKRPSETESLKAAS